MWSDSIMERIEWKIQNKTTVIKHKGTLWKKANRGEELEKSFTMPQHLACLSFTNIFKWKSVVRASWSSLSKQTHVKSLCPQHWQTHPLVSNTGSVENEEKSPCCTKEHMSKAKIVQQDDFHLKTQCTIIQTGLASTSGQGLCWFFPRLVVTEHFS